MSSIFKERDKFSDIFKIFMALMVVAIHTSIFSGDSNLSFITVDGFFRIAVPFFLITNGYYFFYKVKNFYCFSLWLKRCFLLFFVWQIIYLPLYIPLDNWNIEHIVVFLSQVIFGYHHLWYISAMILGGSILYYLKDHKYTIIFCLFLFLIGCALQYVRLILSPGGFYYKIFSQYFLFRNGVFFGFPMMFIGYYIAKNNLVERISPTIKIYGMISGVLFMIVELFFIKNYIFKYNSFHLDMFISLLIISPFIFMTVSRVRLACISNLDTKIFAMFSSLIYFLHPYVIYFFEEIFSSILNDNSTLLFFMVAIVTATISILILKYRAKLYFIF